MSHIKKVYNKLTLGRTVENILGCGSLAEHSKNTITNLRITNETIELDSKGRAKIPDKNTYTFNVPGGVKDLNEFSIKILLDAMGYDERAINKAVGLVTAKVQFSREIRIDTHKDDKGNSFVEFDPNKTIEFQFLPKLKDKKEFGSTAYNAVIQSGFKLLGLSEPLKIKKLSMEGESLIIELDRTERNGWKNEQGKPWSRIPIGATAADDLWIGIWT